MPYKVALENFLNTVLLFNQTSASDLNVSDWILRANPLKNSTQK
jgi:hypothetical protein